MSIGEEGRHAGGLHKRMTSSKVPPVAITRSLRRGKSFGKGRVVARRAVVAFSVFGLTLLLAIYMHLLLTTKVDDNTLPETFLRIADVARLEAITLAPLRDVDLDLYTIRINTWQRDEQLLVSIEHHSKCAGAAQIQVVWCDERDPPAQLEQFSKVVIERHSFNSLNERFHVLDDTPTLGILSMDDDILRPCEAIDSGFFKWTQNPHRMVGFDARTHVVGDDGVWSYGYMSTTEKSNKYSMSLPRYCFLHVDYLKSYMTSLPRPIFHHVQEVFNCEDIAMSFWISKLTHGEPPLLADTWAIKSMVKLYSPERISGTHDHKKLRDACVDSFAQTLDLKDRLKKASIVHTNTPFFEAGAPSSDNNNASPANWRVVDRHEALMKLVHHWKHMPPTDAVQEVLKLRSHTAGRAFVSGLMEDTTPWKKRWK